MTNLLNIKDLSPEELEQFVGELGQKPFRARQIMKWLYHAGATDIDQMTDLAKDFRSLLKERTDIAPPVCKDVAESGDGTRKFLWELSDGAAVESVLIPGARHYTLCVSSQVGCRMGCRFCRTARLGWKRNLTQGEIVDQVLTARRRIDDPADLTNLVFMGMGEALDNLDNVLRALRILTAPGLIALGRRHLSMSTVGLADKLPQLAEAISLGLTVSLNASNNKVRDYLMPINRRFNMETLHQALAAFHLPKNRRITIAYVLLAGVNDTETHARELTRYLHGLRVKLNLIPFNPWPGSEFERPEDQAVLKFQEILVSKQYTAIIRKSKGDDVAAACGQLAGGQDGPTHAGVC